MTKRIGRPPVPIQPGQRFGLLTVIRQGPTRRRSGPRWWCECDCGRACVLVPGYDLHSGNSGTCGCSKRKHGQSTTSEYRCWQNIRQRCENEREPCFPHYGGRGIRVASEWQSFDQFLSDMGYKPSPAHSIERFNVNGDYAPGNCFWATPVEQARNKRTSRFIEHNGERLHIKEWEAKTGINAETLWDRIAKRGWSIEKALTTPSHQWRQKKRGL